MTIMTLKIAVLTCDKYLWCLKPFALLFNRYWDKDQKVTIFGYMPPDFSLPDNFDFVSLAPTQYPRELWSKGMIEALGQIEQDHVLWLWEDYWLKEQVDTTAINNLHNFLHSTDEGSNIISINVTGDRCGRPTAEYVDTISDVDLCTTSCEEEYQFNFQSAIWNKDLLLQNLIPDEDPWQSEENGSKRLKNLGNDGKHIVLGTSTNLVNYAIGMRKDVEHETGLKHLQEGDREEILQLGLIDASLYEIVT